MNSKNQWWYIKTYDQLIEKSKTRGLNKKKLNGYYEKHHIIPKCEGGSNKRDNLVLLTYREHIIAHRLLIRIYPDSKGLKYALYKLINPKSEKGRDNIGVKMFSFNELEEMRISSVEYLKEINIGKKHSDSSKNKMRTAHLGKKLSKETKELLSSIRKGHITSETTRQKISNSNLNKIFSDSHKINLSKSLKGKHLSKERVDSISGFNSSLAKKIIDPTGRVFDTIKSCADYYKISVNGLNYKIKNHPELGFKIISEKEKYSNKFVLDKKSGIVYKSIRSCSDHINRSEKFVSNICKGKSTNKYYNLVFVDKKYIVDNNITPI